MRTQIIQCQCDCHKNGGLHFAPCCQGECRKCGNSFTSGLAEHEAGCRANAAAPELLAACRTALSLIKAYWVEEHGNPVVGLAWGEIERAIAKAEGR